MKLHNLNNTLQILHNLYFIIEYPLEYFSKYSKGSDRIQVQFYTIFKNKKYE